MRKLIISFFFLFAFIFGQAQHAKYDSLKNVLAFAKNDSTKLTSLRNLIIECVFSYPDSAIPYLQQEILLAKKINSDLALANAYYDYGWYYVNIGDYPKALHSIQESIKLAEQSGDIIAIAAAYDLMVVVYLDQEDFKRALSLEIKAKSIIESKGIPIFTTSKSYGLFSHYMYINYGLAQIYEGLNQLDSALKYLHIVDEGTQKIFGTKWGPASMEAGNIYSKLGNYSIALEHYRTGISLVSAADYKKDLMDCYYGIANTFKMMEKSDSSIFYINKVIEGSKSERYSIVQVRALNLLSEVYKSKHNSDSVVKYLQLTIAAKDSLFSRQKVLQMQNMIFDEQVRQQEALQQQKQLQNKIKLYSLLAALLIFLVIAFMLYRNNLHKQKAYALLQKQKHEIDFQKSKVEQTLDELKSTQAQLIQSEKMASLGELTAGIAHEIQNPLNFVNNFSEVNEELLAEMKDELDKGNIDDAKAIANDAMENQQKILHHGKRADAIVKGMLQHSSSGSGKKEPTDINALADEYLRLAYHGLRAKDKSFNATMIPIAIGTDFDETIGNINIIPQDIGRVILNLINNAFYVVDEKRKQNIAGYEPTVEVSSKKDGNMVLVSVKDNGNGIPDSIKEKIFQPFFTTKPTGQGTGLGLSLAYDIVKAHGGELRVETKEGEGSTFIIQL
ncbi:MAG: tetratricopeptide repeat-containing sensor histidine kinase [Chitinophagaceae bacterium]|nr:tetratricopeptide repeat-containing sensor histidine kinase [Chitinophagaceae bacterium]